MAERLRDILKSKSEKCLVGIPRIWNRTDWPTERKAAFWRKYNNPKFTDLYSKKKQYGSAFITRGDAVEGLECHEYFDLVKQLWNGKKALVMHGKGRGFLKRIDLLDGVMDFKVLLGPVADAWKQYDHLLKWIKKEVLKGGFEVVLISLGPTATVLAYDLCEAGIQGLDLGHIGQYYSHIHPKSAFYDGTPQTDPRGV